MKIFFAILFFLACGVFLIWDTSRVALSWMAPSLNGETMYFKDDDPKLFLVWAVLLLSCLSWLFWPGLWRAKTEQPFKPNWKQAVSMGMAVSGLLALFKVVFSDGYLATARSYGETNGYAVCDATRFKYFGELHMARKAVNCPKS